MLCEMALFLKANAIFRQGWRNFIAHFFNLPETLQENLGDNFLIFLT